MQKKDNKYWCLFHLGQTHPPLQHYFLAVHNSSIGDLVTDSLTHWLTEDFTNCHSKSDPRDLWPLRHLIRVMRRHYLTKIDLPTYLPTNWVPEFMTIFVAWQLRVTLDSIHTSCYIYLIQILPLFEQYSLEIFFANFLRKFLGLMGLWNLYVKLLLFAFSVKKKYATAGAWQI